MAWRMEHSQRCAGNCDNLAIDKRFDVQGAEGSITRSSCVLPDARSMVWQCCEHMGEAPYVIRVPVCQHDVFNAAMALAHERCQGRRIRMAIVAGVDQHAPVAIADDVCVCAIKREGGGVVAAKQGY